MTLLLNANNNLFLKFIYSTNMHCYCCQLLSRVWLFCDPMDCSPPGSSVNGISQARIVECIAISFSRGSSWLRDRIHVSCIGWWILYNWANRYSLFAKWGIWKKIQHSSCEVELKCSWILKIRWASLVFHSSHLSCSLFVTRNEIHLLKLGWWKDFLQPSPSPLRCGRWGDLSDKGGGFDKRAMITLVKFWNTY